MCVHVRACVLAHVQVAMLFTLCRNTEILSTWFAIPRKTFDLLCLVSSQSTQISKPFSACKSPQDSGFPSLVGFSEAKLHCCE